MWLAIISFKKHKKYFQKSTWFCVLKFETPQLILNKYVLNLLSNGFYIPFPQFSVSASQFDLLCKIHIVSSLIMNLSGAWPFPLYIQKNPSLCKYKKATIILIVKVFVTQEVHTQLFLSKQRWVGLSLLCCTCYNYIVHCTRRERGGQVNCKSWIQFTQSPLESNLICKSLFFILIQRSQELTLPSNPSKGVNFKEDWVDKLRAEKDNDLDRYRQMAE